VEKDTRIAELEGLRDELKAILARQPGAESALVISDLQVYIASLHHPSSNLEGPSSESPMSQSIFVRSGAYWVWYLSIHAVRYVNLLGVKTSPVLLYLRISLRT